MTITRYFQRHISLVSTLRPFGTEIDKETFEKRIAIFGNRPDFAYIDEHEEVMKGKKVIFKMHTYAHQTPSVVQLIAITGDEECVKEEADYICDR